MTFYLHGFPFYTYTETAVSSKGMFHTIWSVEVVRCRVYTTVIEVIGINDLVKCH